MAGRHEGRGGCGLRREGLTRLFGRGWWRGVHSCSVEEAEAAVGHCFALAVAVVVAVLLVKIARLEMAASAVSGCCSESRGRLWLIGAVKLFEADGGTTCMLTWSREWIDKRA